MKRTLFMLLRPPEGPLPDLMGKYGKGSGVMLLEDGILHAVKKERLRELERTGMMLYALRESVAARGFLHEFPESVELISTAEIPALIMEEYETSLTL